MKLNLETAIPLKAFDSGVNTEEREEPDKREAGRGSPGTFLPILKLAHHSQPFHCHLGKLTDRRLPLT